MVSSGWVDCSAGVWRRENPVSDILRKEWKDHTLPAISSRLAVSFGMALKMRAVDNKRPPTGLDRYVVRCARHDDWWYMEEPSNWDFCTLFTKCRTPIFDRSMVDVKLSFASTKLVILPGNSSHRLREEWTRRAVRNETLWLVGLEVYLHERRQPQCKVN